MARFNLPASAKLKQRKLIDTLFETGQRLNVAPYRIFYSVSKTEPGKGHILFGTGVSKRNFKKAVDRNRVKRICREAYRLQRAALSDLVEKNHQQLLLFFIFTGTTLPSLDTCMPAVKTAMDKIGKKLSSQTT